MDAEDVVEEIVEEVSTAIAKIGNQTKWKTHAFPR